MEQQQPRGRFQRRSSLDNAATGGRRTGSFFQRRSSLGSSNASAPPQQQPPPPPPQPQQQPSTIRRMFRRNSTSNATPSSFAESVASNASQGPRMSATEPISTGDSARERRGSFGFNGGDSQPPRPVVRRGSIGQESSASGFPDEAVTSGALPDSRQFSRQDPHRDSFKIMMDAPQGRRAGRRSSLGPGITTTTGAGSLGPGRSGELSVASNHSVGSIQSVNSEDISGSPGRMSRFKEAFSNPFRRKGKGRSKDKANLQGQQTSSTWSYEEDTDQRYFTGVTTPTSSQQSTPGLMDEPSWKPAEQDILEDEELYPQSPVYNPEDGVKRVHFASEPAIYTVGYGGVATEGQGPEETISFEELKAELWWNSEEMAQIRQECMDVVKDYLDDTEYMEAVTKLFMAYKKSVTEEEIENALEKVGKRRLVRGLEMHIVPRGGLLCEKHRRIVLTNVESATVDGLSNTGEGWYLIRKESMKASRPCRQYAQKMAEHDAMEAIEATISSWAEEDEDVLAYERKRAKQKGADEGDEEEEVDVLPLNEARMTPFLPSSNDVAPMAPKKHVSEVDDEEVNNNNNTNNNNEPANKEPQETRPQQAGEGSSQASK